MCEFFSCVVTADGKFLFTEDDSHTAIIERAGLKDTELYARRFVRLEIEPPFNFVEVDEAGTLPGWFEADAETLKESARQLAIRVGALDEARREALDAAYETFNAAKEPAHAVYQAEMEAADNEFEDAIATFRDQFDQARQAAYDKRHRTIRRAEAAYDKIYAETYADRQNGDDKAFRRVQKAAERRHTKINAAWDESDATTDALDNEYDAIIAPFRAAKNARQDAAWETYKQIREPLTSALNRAADVAWETYVNALAQIEGYVPEEGVA